MLTIFLLNPLFAKDYKKQDKDIESVLKIKPPVKYSQSLKYDDYFKKTKKLEEKDSYKFGMDIDINRELMTIDKLRIDVETKFKGIN
ncbi:hypothetical protein CRU87_09545 [Aliarcobacter trophiarum LMG 25534]|uniref:Transporter n=1 Tax=Aliarcobacter trophiarum LMG 25534 TaxID=1032241 RepID=A0ABY0EWR3_9BACT|nr:hypothetical protein CRU89_07255 [Aliarcobacter trophiarum]RXJ89319.1 hypothetical protein CRU87_09545 [Aliarcobacter trophiarum LMG 25534]